MASVSELPARVRDALAAAMPGEERVLLVTRPSPRHAWADGEVSQAESLRARALLGAARVGLAGPIGLQLLALLVGAPVLVLHDSGFTLGALLTIVIAVAILGVMTAMLLFVATAPLQWMWRAAHSIFVATSHATYVIWDRGKAAYAERTALPRPEDISVRRVRRNGIGDVVVGFGAVYLPPGDGTEGGTAAWDVGLLSVPHAERVGAMLRDAARKLHEVG